MFVINCIIEVRNEYGERKLGVLSALRQETVPGGGADEHQRFKVEMQAL